MTNRNWRQEMEAEAKSLRIQADKAWHDGREELALQCLASADALEGAAER